jgi:hypothetical protein
MNVMKNAIPANTSNARQGCKVLGISLPGELAERIRADAEAGHRPVSRQVEMIARHYYEQTQLEKQA